MDKVVDMIEYHSGSVVSKTLIKKDAGTVTLFAFDKGEGLSEHAAPFDALVLILEGKSRITIAGKDVVASEGDIVTMPAGKPHALRAEAPMKMLLIMIRS